MGIQDPYRIDIVARSEDGGERWVMVAGQGFPDDREAEFTVSLLLKLGFHERHAEHREGSIRNELVSNGEPPTSLLQWLMVRGVEVRVGMPGVPAVGKPSVFALRRDGELDLAALQAANARAFADAHELPYPPVEAGLARLDQIVLARRGEDGLDESDEELEDTRLMVLAGAYAGEVIRTTVGGEWQVGHSPATQPVFLAAGAECDVIANVLGKVRKELKYASHDRRARRRLHRDSPGHPAPDNRGPLVVAPAPRSDHNVRTTSRASSIRPSASNFGSTSSAGRASPTFTSGV